MVARYDAARKALIKHLCDPTRSHSVLSSAIIDLTQRIDGRPDSTWVKNDSECSIEAITNFQKMTNQLGLSALNFSPLHARHPHLDIGGVKVSVTLDLIAMRPDKKGKNYVGGAILLVSKSSASSKHREERCQISAVLALQSSERNLAASGEVDPKLCMTIDVFGGKAYSAKGNYKRLMGTIHSACEEIADRWNSIIPPTGYDGN